MERRLEWAMMSWIFILANDILCDRSQIIWPSHGGMPPMTDVMTLLIKFMLDYGYHVLQNQVNTMVAEWVLLISTKNKIINSIKPQHYWSIKLRWFVTQWLLNICSPPLGRSMCCILKLILKYCVWFHTSKSINIGFRYKHCVWQQMYYSMATKRNNSGYSRCLVHTSHTFDILKVYTTSL